MNILHKLLLIGAISALTSVSHAESHNGCEVSLFPEYTSGRLAFDLDQAKKSVEYSKARQQRLKNSEYPQQSLKNNINHSRWLVQYYGLYTDLQAGTADQVEAKVLGISKNTNFAHSDQAKKLADLFRYVDEDTSYAIQLPVDAYSKAVKTLRKNIEKGDDLPQTYEEKESRISKKLRLFAIEAHLAAYLSDDVRLKRLLVEFQQTIPDSTASPAYDYLEAYIMAHAGKSANDQSLLEQSSKLLKSSLEIFDTSCNLVMAGKASLLLTDVYLNLAKLPRSKQQPVSQEYLSLAIESAFLSETSVSLLYTPDLWRKIHSKSSDVYDLASEAISNVRKRPEYDYLARRAYELSATN